EEAGPVLAKLGDRYGLAMVERERGLIAEHRKSLELAFKLLTGAVAMFDGLPNPVEAAATFLAVADVAAKLGFPLGYDRERLIAIARRAVLTFEENRLPRRQREANQLLITLGIPEGLRSHER